MSLRRSVALLLVALLAATAPARAQTLRSAAWQPNGPVYAMTSVGNTVYIGGMFDHVAPHTGGMAQFDNTAGRISGSLPAVDGAVDAMASDGTGGWYIGGLFSSVQGQPRANLAHLDAGGNVTAWNPGADGAVQALAFDVNNPHLLYVGGRFAKLGGQSRPNLGSVDARTGAVTAWNPTLTVPAPATTSIDALALYGNHLYVGGLFQTANGQPRFDLCAFDTSGALQSFLPDVNGEVRAIALYVPRANPSGYTIYVGGAFTRINGQNAAGIGEVDQSGTTILLSAVVSGTVDALQLTLSQLGAITLWVGGSFSSANGSARENVASFDGAGGLKAWAPNVGGEVQALAYNGTVWIGGAFGAVGGTPRHGLAAITTAGAVTTWNPSPDSTVHALGLWGSSVFAGGDFGMAGGEPRHGLAAINAITGVPTAWNPNPNGSWVRALAYDGTSLWVAGLFDSIGGGRHPLVAQVSPSTGVATAYTLAATPTSGMISCLLVHNGKAYVAGAFDHVGATARSGLAAFDAQGQLLPWSPPGSTTGNTHALGQLGNRILVGGVGATFHGYAFSVDDSMGHPDTWSVTTASGGDDIRVLLAGAPGIFIGGHFTEVDNVTSPNLVCVEPTQGGNLTIPGATLACPGTGVSSLLLSGSLLYVGGAQRTIGGVETGCIGAFDLAHNNVLAWNPDVKGTANALAVAAGSVFGAGIFGGTWTEASAGESRLVGISTAVTGVGDPGAAATGELRVSPNPARGAMELRFALPGGGPARLDVFDVSGRRVRTIALDTGAAGATWDGTDDAGRRAPAGLYFVRLTAHGHALTARAVRLD